ncbi:sigma-70 family RNA polymerase sigma factor [Pseudomonas sp. BIGb0427]|uniref:RNA polymerase subunit sigma n=1 Tax=Pseudomonas vranovensis TaxID=321661 RepID=A0A423DG72_9PSED|nr:MULTISPECIES: sigma-70 family RNA polymerase sigma factor [Pseudomonas]QPG62236.1 sigma-70 family RNA polymerase sigma factor [Pseudomonas sp. BIGb0427]QVM99017.1 sigma-70 family RNA polymerase sigma factor [Pseudomonas sp. SORT22]ROL70513.1 RNA polymerase subunit sigma [Pseudomonas vranovensis]UVL54112.1 sigma-70 family RNA polymerase sigma factor [Pseudomonas sp. B21-035]UVL59371.1 sigma-70 family RNA polymerase sigma factor [Pseudomonas sp. B21-032]
MSDALPSADSHLRTVEALYSGHHGWLYARLRKRLGNALDAADLAQDTFTRILASKVAVFDNPRAYLNCVAGGILANWCQRKSLERAYLTALAQLPVPEAPSPEQRLLVLETLHEIDAMLDALPAVVRRTFLLSQLNGMKYAEIAEQLGVSLISVKRYMKQAFLQCLTLVE